MAPGPVPTLHVQQDVVAQLGMWWLSWGCGGSDRGCGGSVGDVVAQLGGCSGSVSKGD
jgi:hypothetical protein